MTVVVRADPRIVVAPAGVSGAQGPPGPAGSGSTIGVKDEGTLLSSIVERLNFTGAGVSVTGSGADVDVSIPGGGNVVTPQQYGAAADGVTDDSAAFLAALAALRTSATSTAAFPFNKGAPELVIDGQF